MPQITSAIVAENLRKLNDQLNTLLAMEKTRSFIATIQENVGTVRLTCDYKATEELPTAVEGKIRELKHYLPGFAHNKGGINLTGTGRLIEHG